MSRRPPDEGLQNMRDAIFFRQGQIVQIRLGQGGGVQLGIQDGETFPAAQGSTPKTLHRRLLELDLRTFSSKALSSMEISCPGPACSSTALGTGIPPSPIRTLVAGLEEDRIWQFADAQLGTLHIQNQMGLGPLGPTGRRAKTPG